MAQASERRADWGARALIVAAFIGLGFALVRFLAAAAAVIGFPYELDYGEGIVWQQAQLLFDGKGYGAIDRLPAIVFHYPPVFHWLSGALAAVGIDPLAAGRIVSVAATLLSALFAGLIVRETAAGQARRPAVLISALLGGLALLAFWPVAAWGVLMRVDMAALAFSLAGVWLGIRAMERPGLIAPAALCFVLAIFAKQTTVAGATATFLALFLVRPRTAWTGIAIGAAAGLALLGALAWATDGGFLRHILLYNINRFDWPRLWTVPQAMVMHLLFFTAIAIGLAGLGAERFGGARGGGLAGLRQRLAGTHADAALFAILVYAALASLMLVTIAKSGSNVNYLIEWMAVAAILLGRLSLPAARAATGESVAAAGPLRLLVPAALAAQPFIVPPPPYAPVTDPERRPALAALSAEIRAARRPIISDDMVLLLRSGKPVQWEPAIFAELASTGLWDERPFVEAIRAHRFAFFVTVGRRGDRLFDSRYNPAVAAAIDAAYPVKREKADYVVHLPAPGR